MILQALYELADFEGLADDLDFQDIPVAYWIILDESGKLLGIQDRRYLPAQEGKKKPKLVAPALKCPARVSGKTSGVKSNFLVENAQYALGSVPPERADRADRARQCLQAFRDLVDACAEATADIGAEAVRAFCDDLLSCRQSVPWNDEWKGNDLFAYALSSEPDVPVHLRPAVMDYWREQREERVPPNSTTRRCVITGAPIGNVGLFPQLKRVPGGTPSGVSLVSFNAPAFESHGWKSNDNAPFSRKAAESCATALNRLLHPAYPDPHQPGHTLPERRYRITSDTVVVFWSPSRRGSTICDGFPSLLEPDPEEVGEMFRSVWRGKAPAVDEPESFYAMTLTGTQGRVIVRDWFETTVERVLENLAQYFADLELVRNVPPPKKRDLPPALPLLAVLRSIAVRGDLDRLPPHLAAELFHAAIGGTRFPRAILFKAIERMRAEIGRKEWSDLDRRDARMALIKACLNRQRRLDATAAATLPEVKPMLDETVNKPGYVLGRLMAVLEKLQEEALKNINTTLVDKYFKRASTTPLYVFNHLLKNRAAHERKLKRENHGLFVFRKNQIDNLIEKIDGQANIPRTLPIEEQALFMLGYHHQRHALWQKKSAEPAA